MNRTSDHLKRRIDSHQVICAMVGLSYVRLPLVMELCEANFHVIGYDVQQRVCDLLMRGKSHIQDVPAAQVAKHVNAGRFEATADKARLDEVDTASSAVSRKHEYKRTLAQEGASIGANATIVCGATLGRYCFIGAGAVVTKDVPAYALMTGVPTRRTGWMCERGVKLREDIMDLVCPDCSRRYTQKGGQMTPLAKGAM